MLSLSLHSHVCWLLNHHLFLIEHLSFVGRVLCYRILELYIINPISPQIYAAYRQGNLFNELCMTGAGTKDCAKILKEIPDAVHFKASLSKEEEICSVSDPNSGKCTKKPSGKTEL